MSLLSALLQPIEDWILDLWKWNNWPKIKECLTFLVAHLVPMKTLNKEY